MKNIGGMAGGMMNIGTDAIKGANNVFKDASGNVLNKMVDVVSHNTATQALRKNLSGRKESMVDMTSTAMGQMREYMGNQGASAMMAR